LDRVKDEYRREIEGLVQQKDDLTSEINELRQSRALFIEETTALNRQHAVLMDENEEATRTLASTRHAISRLRGSSPQVEQQQAPQRNLYTTQNSSLPFPPFPSSSPRSRTPTFPTSRSPAHSPTPPESDHVERPGKSLEVIEPSVAKKFKWGKGKVEAGSSYGSSRDRVSSNATSGTTASGTMSNGSNGVVSRSTATSESTGPAGRIHIFQQTSILRPVKCEYCGDKMWGLNEVRCGSESIFLASTSTASVY
jgi:hypothetical protein